MKDKYIIFADGKSPHTLKWIKELNRYFDLYLISLNGFNDEVLLFLDKNKIYNFNHENNNKICRLLKIFDLIKIIKKIKPKYLNAHYLSSYGFLAALIKIKIPTIKLIQSTWGTDILVTPYENILKYKIAYFSLMYSDIITSDSAHMSDKIQNIYTKSNIMTFPFGLDSFEPKDIEKDDYLIFSNRALFDNYNIDKIIYWFSSLNTKYKLIIANKGNKEEYLKKLTRNLKLEDRIEFVGFLSKERQIEYYNKSKFYISIPDSDSTSVSLLEAMRYGCIPIVSNICANREWILDGVNGFYFNKDLAIEQIYRDMDIAKLNQSIILQKAIFEKSILKFINRIEKL